VGLRIRAQDAVEVVNARRTLPAPSSRRRGRGARRAPRVPGAHRARAGTRIWAPGRERAGWRAPFPARQPRPPEAPTTNSR
jgi:hypothetical protein